MSRRGRVFDGEKWAKGKKKRKKPPQHPSFTDKILLYERVRVSPSDSDEQITCSEMSAARTI